MKHKTRKYFSSGICFLGGFCLWTLAVLLVDVQPVGPQGSAVGLATINGWFHQLTGVHWTLYTLTDRLSLIPLGMVPGFALLGLTQWIQRKHLRMVDRSLLVLGGFYMAVMAMYFFCETFIVNYRPVLIEGILEASYPSSTTMLALCVIGSAILQFRAHIRNRALRGWVTLSLTTFMLFMVAGRMISGVHWLTDIIGGILLSCGMLLVYHAISNCNT